MKKKIILSAVLSIVLCVSLISGATMALFTSESKVNIAVTSGKVKVAASVSGLTLYSMGEQQTDAFANGGTATYDEATNAITLTNVTPGDKVTFSIDVTNESTVAINYRVQTVIRGGLASYLQTTATIGGVEQAITVTTSAWTQVAPLGAIDSIPVAIELPEGVGNEAQDKNAVITVGIIAVQGNGTDAVIPDGLRATPATINDVMAAANEGDTIALTAGYYAEIHAAKTLNFVGEDGAVVGYMNFNGKANCMVKNVTFDASGAKIAWGKSSGRDIQTGIYANLVGSEKNTVSADGLQVIGCTFTGVPVNAASYAPITLYDRGRSGGCLDNLTIDSCVFDVDATYYVYAYYIGGGTHTITNNVFGSNATSANTAVYLGGNQGNVVVTGNTFVNTDGIIVSLHSAGYNTVTATVTNNTVTATTPGSYILAALRNYSNWGATMNVSGNTVVGGTMKGYFLDTANYDRYDVEIG